MKIPNAENAAVPKQKITNYLLNPDHPAGGSKATFFLRFGFTIKGWQILADALRNHAQETKSWPPSKRNTAHATPSMALSAPRTARA